MDEFGDIVDSIYKTYFTKFWGQESFEEVKTKKNGFKQNQIIFDYLTDHGYKYDLIHRTYTDPYCKPVLNPDFVFLNLKNKDAVPWQTPDEKE